MITRHKGIASVRSMSLFTSKIKNKISHHKTSALTFLNFFLKKWKRSWHAYDSTIFLNKMAVSTVIIWAVVSSNRKADQNILFFNRNIKGLEPEIWLQAHQNNALCLVFIRHALYCFLYIIIFVVVVVVVVVIIINVSIIIGIISTILFNCDLSPPQNILLLLSPAVS